MITLVSVQSPYLRKLARNLAPRRPRRGAFFAQPKPSWARAMMPPPSSVVIGFNILRLRRSAVPTSPAARCATPKGSARGLLHHPVGHYPSKAPPPPRGHRPSQGDDVTARLWTR